MFTITIDIPDDVAEALRNKVAARRLSVEAWFRQRIAVWVLSSVYQKTPSEIVDAIEMLLNHEHLTIENADVVSLALDKFRAKSTIGFSDWACQPWEHPAHG